VDSMHKVGIKVAALSDGDRAACSSRFIQDFFANLRHTADLTTAEVKTLVDDLDTWLDSQTTEANQAITLAVRNKASNSTKFAALAYVALKRAGVI
jgi:hypothetical protein